MIVKKIFTLFSVVLIFNGSCNNTGAGDGRHFDERLELKELIETMLMDSPPSCKKDSDCILVSEDCCGCNSGGSSIAIHSLQGDRYNIQLKRICSYNKNRICLASYRCGEFETRCSNRRCITIDKKSKL